MIQYLLSSASLLLLFAPGARVPQRESWPAEVEEAATNLSEITKGFRKDLSGAVWNPVTRTLWVCRNGPGEDSRLWALKESADGQLELAMEGETPAEWREIGEAEGVTFASYDEQVVFLISEDEGAIRELDVSTCGKPLLVRTYDLSAVLPTEGADGAEGITFVPDAQLAAAKFVDAAGEPYISRGGCGGLMFVAHQNGGGIYAFDLDRKTGGVHFVGTYRVPSLPGEHAKDLSKTVALEFDRSNGWLYAWHSRKGKNILSITTLASTTGPGVRDLQRLHMFEGPGERSYEGLAVAPATDCGPEGRALYLTVDDSKKHSLVRYDRFKVGCRPAEADEPPR